MILSKTRAFVLLQSLALFPCQSGLPVCIASKRASFDPVQSVKPKNLSLNIHETDKEILTFQVSYAI